jgi:hypothetical protein
MNNIDEITCKNCEKIFALPVNGLHDNGKFTCMDCIGKILSDLSTIKRNMGFKRYDE